jgi:hypothetical protein
MDANCFENPRRKAALMTTPPERMNFFDGQVLGAADFEGQQQYLLGRLRRHNRFAHGWGVLRGLHVSIEGSDVLVSAGVAIDCEGNEVELLEPQRIGIGTLTQPFFVGVTYSETFSSPTPGPNGVSCATVIEGAQVELSTVNACMGHAKLGPGTPGCGQRHAIVLARVRPHKGSWQLRLAKCGA